MSFRNLPMIVVALAAAGMLVLTSCAPGDTGGEDQAQRLYVGDAGKVIVLDPASKTLVSTITVGGAGQLEWLAVRPDGRKLYCSDRLGNKLHIINTDTNTISVSLDILNHPRGIAFNASGDTAVVTRFSPPDTGVVDVIDTGTESVSWSFYNYSTAESLAGVDVHPLYNRIYAAGVNGTLLHQDLGASSVSSLDPYYPPSWNVFFDIAVVPTEGKLYAAGASGVAPYLADITTDAGGVPFSFNSYSRPASAHTDTKLRLSWNGQKLYWANYSYSYLDEVDRGSPSTMTRINLPGTADAADVVFSSDSSKAYVLSEVDQKIYVIDTATRAVVDNFAIPGASTPKSLAYALLP